jgi:DnaJ-class molecular chaperone
MTPAERALLLAVAKRVPGSSYLDRLIAAVEAEAAPPVNSYGKTATQGVVAITDIMQRCSPTDARLPLGEPCRSCTGHIRENNPMRCAECSPTAHQNYERLWQDTTCPTCNGLGFGLPSGPKQDSTCPTCEGCGNKEKTDDHT